MGSLILSNECAKALENLVGNRIERRREDSQQRISEHDMMQYSQSASTFAFSNKKLKFPEQTNKKLSRTSHHLHLHCRRQRTFGPNGCHVIGRRGNQGPSSQPQPIRSLINKLAVCAPEAISIFEATSRTSRSDLWLSLSPRCGHREYAPHTFTRF